VEALLSVFEEGQKRLPRMTPSYKNWEDRESLIKLAFVPVTPISTLIGNDGDGTGNAILAGQACQVAYCIWYCRSSHTDTTSKNLESRWKYRYLDWRILGSLESVTARRLRMNVVIQNFKVRNNQCNDVVEQYYN
jgi:hypothetical protein